MAPEIARKIDFILTMTVLRKVRKNFMYSITITYDHDSTPEGNKKFHVQHYSYV